MQPRTTLTRRDGYDLSVSLALAVILAKLPRGEDCFEVENVNTNRNADRLIAPNGRELGVVNRKTRLAWASRGWVTDYGCGYAITPEGHEAAKAVAKRSA